MICDPILLSNIVLVQISQICPKSVPSSSHVAYSHHVSLVCLNLIPSWPFLTVTFSTGTGQLFVECPSIWVCLMFPHVQTQAVHFWQDFCGNDVSFPVHPISGHTLAGCPTAGGGNLDNLVKVPAARFLHRKANTRMLIELDIKWSLHKSQIAFQKLILCNRVVC